MLNAGKQGALFAATIFVAAILFGCSASSGDDAASPTTSTSPPADGQDSTGTGGTGGAELTAEDICSKLDAATVSDALRLDVTGAEAASSGTPQCSYAYTASQVGPASNVTVAALRTDGDLGGRTGKAAYDYVVQVNASIAGGAKSETVELDAGDQATRMSGVALHLGIVRVGDHVYTLLVPAKDASTNGVDKLVSAMADDLG